MASGLRMKALVSSIVQSPEYRAGKWNDTIDAAKQEDALSGQLVSSGRTHGVSLDVW